MKNFKTFDEQILILQKRKLIINNYEYALDCLQRENYYNIINAYKDLFTINNNTINEEFIKGITFEEIYALYTFDRDLRFLLLKEILNIESLFKTSLAYTFSLLHKDIDPLDSSLFYKKEKARRRIELINEMLNKKDNDKIVCHFRTKHEFIPFWVLVNLITLGDVSYLYHCMYIKDQREIAKLVSSKTDYKLEVKTLAIMIKNLSILRNKCAHNNRIYDFSAHTPIPFNKSISSQLKYDLNKHSGDLFAMIMCIKILSKRQSFNLFYVNLKSLMEKLECKLQLLSKEKILKKMGFDIDWEKHILV